MRFLITLPIYQVINVGMKDNVDLLLRQMLFHLVHHFMGKMMSVMVAPTGKCAVFSDPDIFDPDPRAGKLGIDRSDIYLNLIKITTAHSEQNPRPSTPVS
jgi:hypothetical protein